MVAVSSGVASRSSFYWFPIKPILNLPFVQKATSNEHNMLNGSMKIVIAAATRWSIVKGYNRYIQAGETRVRLPPDASSWRFGQKYLILSVGQQNRFVWLRLFDESTRVETALYDRRKKSCCNNALLALLRHVISYSRRAGRNLSPSNDWRLFARLFCCLP